MTRKFIPNKLLIAFLAVFTLLSLGSMPAFAQTDPLNLGEILTGLQSKSGDFSMAEKNSFITESVMKRGVTFQLTTLIRNELMQVGANNDLLRAIAIKAPKPVSTSIPTTTTTTGPKPSVKPDKIWVEPDIVKSGLEGTMVHVRFNVYELKDTKVMLSVRFQNSLGKNLLSSNDAFRNKNGELALFSAFTPVYSATVLNDVQLFLPYKEINLPAGIHDLKIDADLIYPDGRSIQHIDFFEFTLNKPAPTLRAGKGIFDRIWIDYNQRQDGMLGMVVHQKFTASNLKDTPVQVRVLFTNQKTGKSLVARGNSKYRTASGNVGYFAPLKPAYTTAVFKDLSFFIPYSEFNLPVGSYTLNMHTDLIYPDGTLIQHFTNKPFKYNRTK